MQIDKSIYRLNIFIVSLLLLVLPNKQIIGSDLKIEGFCEYKNDTLLAKFYVINQSITKGTVIVPSAQWVIPKKENEFNILSDANQARRGGLSFLVIGPHDVGAFITDPVYTHCGAGYFPTFHYLHYPDTLVIEYTSFSHLLAKEKDKDFSIHLYLNYGNNHFVEQSECLEPYFRFVEDMEFYNKYIKIDAFDNRKYKKNEYFNYSERCDCKKLNNDIKVLLCQYFNEYASAHIPIIRR